MPEDASEEHCVACGAEMIATDIDVGLCSECSAAEGETPSEFDDLSDLFDRELGIGD
jgi:hypothetical protein